MNCYKYFSEKMTDEDKRYTSGDTTVLASDKVTRIAEANDENVAANIALALNLMYFLMGENDCAEQKPCSCKENDFILLQILDRLNTMKVWLSPPEHRPWYVRLAFWFEKL